MDSQIFTNVLRYIDNVCNAFIAEKVHVVASTIAPAAYTFLGVYVILWGLASMRGMIQEPLTDMAVRMVKIAFIFGVGIQLAEYNIYVVDTMWNGPQELASAIAGTSGGAIGPTLDSILAKGFALGKLFYSKAGLLNGDFGAYIDAFAIWAISMVVTVYVGALIALAKIALSLLIAVGPLFIISLLFQPTANFFNSWVQQLANYFMLMVLMVAGNVFVLTLFQRAANASGITSTAQIDKLFPFFVTGGLSLFVIAQIPGIASGLAGGVSLSSYGMGRLGLSVLGRGAKGVTGRASRGMSKGVRKAARAARAAYQSRKQNTVKSS
ncbi:trbL/VirB6 plasmid conjugal transfer family protein [Burkholderia thailandensis 34]|uniref:type IV secretion system protein n=1 Tax=Burkholderia thailandensis TaxID=57975 RepID=UPI0005D9267E|nr:type IV secretion system protein [Burkholderia thailandensis]AJY28380.1 trbL/VirB6 plasmid conjugal transfer family protein [Burkholderia thailandensis 34]AOJ55444.1 hypothetical protein AQ477_02220 [Burkholderia thailandensis]KXF60554.1 hypothetical protein AQ476_04110 [Burkholderia thailandensis]PNE75390.1 hypothetical protein A8H37_27540 [Burkholderia thailandensis]